MYYVVNNKVPEFDDFKSEFTNENDAMNYARDLMREYQAQENYDATVEVIEVTERPVCRFSTGLDAFTLCEKF